MVVQFVRVLIKRGRDVNDNVPSVSQSPGGHGPDVLVAAGRAEEERENHPAFAVADDGVGTKLPLGVIDQRLDKSVAADTDREARRDKRVVALRLQQHSFGPVERVARSRVIALPLQSKNQGKLRGGHEKKMFC